MAGKKRAVPPTGSEPGTLFDLPISFVSTSDTASLDSSPAKLPAVVEWSYR